jgi:hypothetical protein
MVRFIYHHITSVRSNQSDTKQCKWLFITSWWLDLSTIILRVSDLTNLTLNSASGYWVRLYYDLIKVNSHSQLVNLHCHQVNLRSQLGSKLTSTVSKLTATVSKLTSTVTVSKLTSTVSKLTSTVSKLIYTVTVSKLTYTVSKLLTFTVS